MALKCVRNMAREVGVVGRNHHGQEAPPEAGSLGGLNPGVETGGYGSRSTMVVAMDFMVFASSLSGSRITVGTPSSPAWV